MSCSLSKKGEMTAYGIRKAIMEATGEEKSFGAIYPALKRLEKAGMIGFRVEGKRKVYSLTKTGKERLKELRKRKRLFIKRMEELANALSEFFGYPSPSIRKIFSPSFEIPQGKVPEARKILRETIRKIRRLKNG